MILKVRINENNSKTYHLVEWSAQGFAADPCLRLQTDNLSQVKDDFTNLEKFEIYQNDNLVATYESYDSYSDIAYEGRVWVDGEQTFNDCLRVRLQKRDLASIVERIDKQVNPVHDENAMSLEELRQYRLSQIAEACQADIYAGDVVEISTGSRLFSYTAEDQMNLANAVNILTQLPTIEVLPYHANGYSCELMRARDIVTIYMTLQLRLTRLTTYCNLLNMYVRGMSERRDISEARYGMELPEEYNAKLEEISMQSLEIMQEMAKKFMPEGDPVGPIHDEGGEDDGSETGGSTEPTEPTESTEPTEPTTPVSGEEDGQEE